MNSPPTHKHDVPPERFDPLEADPDHEDTIRVAHERAVDAAESEMRTKFPDLGFSRDDHMLGFCHVIWRYKKRILREDYGLDWQSPAELNPHIWYD